MADGNITKDAMYGAVAPDDFESMLTLDRYHQRSTAFDKIISATHDHFWDPLDAKYIDFTEPFDMAATMCRAVRTAQGPTTTPAPARPGAAHISASRSSQSHAILVSRHVLYRPATAWMRTHPAVRAFRTLVQAELEPQMSESGPLPHATEIPVRF